MLNRQINKALKSDKPINGLHALIPPDRREAFRQFASKFGFDKGRIKSALENEKR